MAPSGSAATSCATRVCSARLYFTTGGQAFRGTSEPTVPQPVKKVIAAARTPGRSLQHLPLNIMMSFQMLQPRGRAPYALTGSAKVKNEERNGEGGKDHPG
jgi:hypothetical protein